MVWIELIVSPFKKPKLQVRFITRLLEFIDLFLTIKNKFRNPNRCFNPEPDTSFVTDSGPLMRIAE